VNDGALGQTGSTNLLTAKGPWVAIVDQPLPGGRSASGNVGFRDAWDYVIESRAQTGDTPLKSVYVHVLEGYREGEQSAIKQVRRRPLAEDSRAAQGALALELETAAGHTDTVVFQPDPGRVHLTGAADLTTDARYALVRRDRQGQVTEAHLVRGTSLACGKFAVHTEAQSTGTVMDLVGDLTGTRLESALIVRPDAPWPLGAALAGKQMLVRVINNHDEGFTIEKVSRLTDGLVRVDLAGHPPFSSGWYQVSQLDPQHSDTLKSNRQLWAGINTPWWWGCRAWFPELNRVFTIRTTSSDRETLQVAEGKDLGAEGVKAGAWFTIYAIEPGVTVSVPGDLSWRREALRPASMVRHLLRATSAAALSLPAEQGELWLRVGRGQWGAVKPAIDAARGTMTVNLSGDENAGQEVSLIAGKPAWLQLEDSGPPQVTAVLVDGKPQKPAPTIDLGRVTSPQRLVVEARDADNPIDEASAVVSLDGKPVPAAGPLVRVRTTTPDRKAVAIEFDLKAALASEPEDRPARHTIAFHADDFAVDDQATDVVLTYMKLVQPRGDAVYLSDLKEESSLVHGGLRKDCNYFGQPLQMRGVLFAKCLQTHVEAGGMTSHSEVIYDLSALPPRQRLRALVGISDDSGGGGSVTFEVQVDKDGKWETRYTSPVLRGGQDPLGIDVDIAGARRIRLYCTDAGDGIGSDHAAWAEARLE
jgi:hypothetical protein